MIEDEREFSGECLLIDSDANIILGSAEETNQGNNFEHTQKVKAIN